MYIKDLLNKKDLKISTLRSYQNYNSSIEVYTYKDGKRINNNYFDLSDLYSNLYENKSLTLFRVDKVNNLTVDIIEFSFDERKLEISSESKLIYNLKVL